MICPMRPVIWPPSSPARSIITLESTTKLFPSPSAPPTRSRPRLAHIPPRNTSRPSYVRLPSARTCLPPRIHRFLQPRPLIDTFIFALTKPRDPTPTRSILGCTQLYKASFQGVLRTGNTSRSVPILRHLLPLLVLICPIGNRSCFRVQTLGNYLPDIQADKRQLFAHIRHGGCH
jgi:hypothetical protein